MLQALFSLIFAVLFAVLTGPAAAMEKAAEGPALWRWQKGPVTIYLFGSIHTLPKALKWRTPLFDKAFSESKTLTLELPPNDMDPLKAALTFLYTGVWRDGTKTKDHLPADLYDKAKAAYLTKKGRKAADFELIQTWVIAREIEGDRDGILNPDPKERLSGADFVLMAEAQKRKLPIGGLERLEDQIYALSNYPEAKQLAMLRRALDRKKGTAIDLNRLIAAWKRGDVETIGKAANEEAAAEFRQAVLLYRNKRWVQPIRLMSLQPGTHMVVAGAAHFAGPGNMIELMAKAGYKFERIQ